MSTYLHRSHYVTTNQLLMGGVYGGAHYQSPSKTQEVGTRELAWQAHAKGYSAPKHNYAAPHARHEASAEEAADGAAFSHARHTDDQAIGGGVAAEAEVGTRELAYQAHMKGYVAPKHNYAAPLARHEATAEEAKDGGSFAHVRHSDSQALGGGAVAPPAAAAGAGAEVQERSLDRMVTCYSCGQGFSTYSLGRHLQACPKQREINYKVLPSNLRPPAPQPPSAPMPNEKTSVAEIRAYNEEANNNYRASMATCPACSRKFEPDRLLVHMKSCKGESAHSASKPAVHGPAFGGNVHYPAAHHKAAAAPAAGEEVGTRELAWQAHAKGYSAPKHNYAAPHARHEASAEEAKDGAAFSHARHTDDQAIGGGVAAEAEVGTRELAYQAHMKGYVAPKHSYAAPHARHEATAEEAKDGGSFAHVRHSDSQALGGGAVAPPVADASAGAGVQDRSLDRMVTCYSCGQGFSTYSLGRHLQSCTVQRAINYQSLPSNLRPPAPKPPALPMPNQKSTVAEIQAYNAQANENYRASMAACPACGRKFEPDRLPVHMKSCKGESAHSPSKSVHGPAYGGNVSYPTHKKSTLSSAGSAIAGGSPKSSSQEVGTRELAWQAHAKGYSAPKHNYAAPHARHEASAEEAADGAAFSHARHTDDQAIGGGVAAEAEVGTRELAYQAHMKGYVAPKHNYAAPHARHEATAEEAKDGGSFAHVRHSDSQALGGGAVAPPAAAAEAGAEVQERSLDRMVTCYSCGQGFSTYSLPKHLKACPTQRDINMGSLPRNMRPPAPQPPTLPVPNEKSTVAEIRAYNEQANNNYRASMATCPNCNRKFEPDRLPVHLRGCKGDASHPAATHLHGTVRR